MRSALYEEFSDREMLTHFIQCWDELRRFDEDLARSPELKKRAKVKQKQAQIKANLASAETEMLERMWN